MYESEASFRRGETPVLDVKGLESVRRDQPPATVKVENPHAQQLFYLPQVHRAHAKSSVCVCYRARLLGRAVLLRCSTIAVRLCAGAGPRSTYPIVNEGHLCGQVVRVASMR